MAKTKLLKNKKMNTATFELRKEVMKMIYEAKQIVGTMPRITVRITENNGTTLGVAAMKGNTIWIPERTVSGDRKRFLREVVYHELCHALWGIEHDDNCPLMSSVIGQRPLDRDLVQTIFKQYAQGL